MEFAVFGIPAAVFVVAIVQLLKSQFGIEGKWAILAAVVIGIVLSVANYAAKIVPGFAAWYEVVLAGLMAGLAACGIYDVAHKPADPIDLTRRF